MALINKIDNTATITYDGNPINSNSVETLLLLAPTITKTVDKLTANVGDTLTYTVTITNISLSPVTNILFSDSIVEGASYVVDSFMVDGVVTTPTITDNTVSYTIASIAALGITNIQFQVTVVGG